MSRLYLLTILLTATISTPDAVAGPLSKIVSGMKKRSGQDEESKPRHRTASTGVAEAEEENSQPSSHYRDHRADAGDDDDGDYDDGAFGAQPALEDDPTPGAFVLTGWTPYGRGTDVSIYASLHRVDDSNGAASISVRASYEDYGLSVTNISYYEQTTAGNIGLHLWTLTGQYRVARRSYHRRTEIWVGAGLAGASSEGLGLLGFTAGAEATHRLSDNLGIVGTGRFLAYQDGIRAVEARAGVALSFVRLSYRVLEFNVGPTLHGPEVGIAIGF